MWVFDNDIVTVGRIPGKLFFHENNTHNKNHIRIQAKSHFFSDFLRKS